MPPEKDQRDGPDDLFDDLDTYFSPIDDPGWPARPGGDEPKRAGGKPGDPTAEFAEQDWSRLRDALGEEGDEQELEMLSASAGSDPGGLDPDDKPVPPQPGGGQPSGPARQPEEEPPPPPPAPTEPGAEPGEPPAELSIDDLKKPPPEYRDLPPAPDEEPEEELLVDDIFTEPEAPGAEGVAAGAPSDVPSLAEVEAAADRLAEEFRTPGGVGDDLLEVDRPPEPRRIKVGEPESLMGPAWEEPTSRTITGEPEVERPPRRNLPAAVITAAVLAVAALITVAIEKWAFAIVAGIVVLLGQAELYATMKRRGHQPGTALGLLVGGLILTAAYFRGEQGLVLAVGLGLVATFLWFMAAAPKARSGLLASVAVTSFGILYVPFLAGYVILILIQANSGDVLMLAVLGLTFWYDIAAFAIGTLWGSRPLAPTISPKKSWEGLLGATMATFAVSIAILPSIDIIEPSTALGLAAVVVVFAPIGDLAESALKRDLGVKDMGAILPGHGGMLDRIDAALFVAPAAFYFFRLIF